MGFPIYIYIAALLIVALFSTRLMKLLRLPNVTGYIITGILMGPFVFGLLFNNFTFDGIKDSIIYQYVNQISWISSVALGFIAFSIGTSFKTSTLKAVGKKVLVITVFEAVMASILVIISLLVAHFISKDQIPMELVLILGAIASATAPAATLMVIKQYNAKGSLVDTLLPVVALDDAVALILFALLFQIAKGLGTGGNIEIYSMLVKPFIEIAISVGAGIVIGIIVSLLNKLFKSRNNRLVSCIFSVFFAIGLYELFKLPALGGFELSSLLICMVSGAIYINFVKNNSKTLEVLDRFTSPVYMMFFVLSGASLDLSIFFNGSGLLVVGIALIYIVFRVIGKCTGAYTGASITHCEPKIRKYLGFTLIPQAGVAIGLATTSTKLFMDIPGKEALGGLILAIILTSTLIYELVGPLVTKAALMKANEIQVEPKKIKTVEK